MKRVFFTCDLSDDNPNAQVLEPIFKSYGAKTYFSGQVETLKVFEDNALVRTALEQDGTGKVLVIDGGGSLRCALVGGNIAQLAFENHWNGIIVFGCIRDSVEINEIEIGIKALGTMPKKSIKKGAGDKQIALKFAGASIMPNHFIYADEDGIVCSNVALV